MNFFEVKNLSFNYQGLRVLEKLNFSLKREEFLAIVGPLGCGKTTLLKILGGLIPASQGKVCLQEQILTKPSPKISIVFQKANLLPWLTVEQNISLPLIIQKMSSAKISRKVKTVLNLVKLNEFRHLYPAELSGGMEQLTSLARAFVNQAQILLLDEPFASLDCLTREKMNLELLNLWQKKKKSIILVTHSLEEAVLLADRILVLGRRPARIKKVVKNSLPRPRKPSSVNYLLATKIKKMLYETIG